MDKANKIKLLTDLLESAKEITVYESSDQTFRTWRNRVERVFEKVFGKDSIEIQQFRELDFCDNVTTLGVFGSDSSADHRYCFERDMKILISSIKDYALEFQEESETLVSSEKRGERLECVFVSHSSTDVKIVEEVVEFLEIIGLQSSSIFCSSLPGYGIELGDENFIDSLKRELFRPTLVLFVLTENFYASPICLCEMGAAWALSRNFIPIIVPPFQFADMKGVIPLAQGFDITDSGRLNEFKTKVESLFKLNPIEQTVWERKRERILRNLEPLTHESTRRNPGATHRPDFVHKIGPFDRGETRIVFTNRGATAAFDVNYSFSKSKGLRPPIVINDNALPIKRVKMDEQFTMRIARSLNSPRRFTVVLNFQDENRASFEDSFDISL